MIRILEYIYGMHIASDIPLTYNILVSGHYKVHVCFRIAAYLMV